MLTRTSLISSRLLFSLNRFPCSTPIDLYQSPLSKHTPFDLSSSFSRSTSFLSSPSLSSSLSSSSFSSSSSLSSFSSSFSTSSSSSSTSSSSSSSEQKSIPNASSPVLLFAVSSLLVSFSLLSSVGLYVRHASAEKERREASALGLPPKCADPLAPSALSTPQLLRTALTFSLIPTAVATRLGSRYFRAAVARGLPLGTRWAAATGLRLALATQATSVLLTCACIVLPHFYVKARGAAQGEQGAFLTAQLARKIQCYSAVDPLDDELRRVQQVLSPSHRCAAYLSMALSTTLLATFVGCVTTWPIPLFTFPAAFLTLKLVAKKCLHI